MEYVGPSNGGSNHSVSSDPSSSEGTQEDDEVVFLGVTCDLFKPDNSNVEEEPEFFSEPELHKKPKKMMEMTMFGDSLYDTFESRKNDFTVVKIRDYNDHWTSKNYITYVNTRIANKIQEWVEKSEKLMCEIQVNFPQRFSSSVTVTQCEFTQNFALEVAEEIDDHEVWAIDVLNRKTLKECFLNIKTDEQAEFVEKMAMCDKFDVIYYPAYHLDNYSVVTRFDGNYKTQKAFGKGYLTDFSKFNEMGDY